MTIEINLIFQIDKLDNFRHLRQKFIKIDCPLIERILKFLK